MFRELKNEKTLSDGNIYNSNLNKTCVSVGLFHIISNSETALFRSILPLLVISILNILNIKTIFRSKRDLNLDLKREKRFAFVLVCLSILYLLFNLPLACIQITDIFYTDIFININSKKLITIELIYDISRAWAFVYYGIGFFVNISFSNRTHTYWSEFSTVAKRFI